MSRRTGWTGAGLGLAGTMGLLLGLAGCGTPGAPQPPSLNLPDRVADLAATRAGNQVTLHWTMPRKSTDKLLLKGDVDVRVCRREGAAHRAQAGSDLKLAPGAAGTWAETLPAALAAGAPRALDYFVELRNGRGRSAGLSNGATVLAGEAPGQVTGLGAELRRTGVALKWTPDGEDVPVRLRRTLLTPPAKEKQKEGLLTPPAEPLEQNLLVETGVAQGRALDKSIRLGETYEYRAQRVARVTEGGRTLELAGAFSLPVRVEASDVFPPAVPAGLAAVGTPGENGAGPAIDLSWQPDTEADLAGYVVYRREPTAAGKAGGAWVRISPAQPVVGPAFHDANVEAGHTYRYAVSSVDHGGHESERSAETEETAPTQ